MTKEEFEELYRNNQLMVYNLVLNYLQNIEDAEEVTQDVFINAYHHYQQFQGASSTKTWLYRIAINKSLDFIKAKNRKKRFSFITSMFSESGELQHEKPDFIHPGIILENQEKSVYLYKAIDELPENQKTAFILSHIEQMSNIEIAAIMNRTIGSVESLLQRGKENLRKKLGKYFEIIRRN